MKIQYLILLVLFLQGCSDELTEIRETYPDGSLKSIFKIDQDSLKQKKGEVYLKNGNKMAVFFKDDSLHGDAFEYFSSGVLKKKTHFDNNIETGWAVTYDRNSNLIDSSLYIDGICKEYKLFYTNGDLKQKSKEKQFNHEKIIEYENFNKSGYLSSISWMNFDEETNFYLKKDSVTGEIREFRFVGLDYDKDTINIAVYGTEESIDSLRINYLYEIDVNVDSLNEKGYYFKYEVQTTKKRKDTVEAIYSFYNAQNAVYKSSSKIKTYELGSNRLISLPKVDNNKNQIIEVTIYSKLGNTRVQSSYSKLLNISK